MKELRRLQLCLTSLCKDIRGAQEKQETLKLGGL